MSSGSDKDANVTMLKDVLNDVLAIAMYGSLLCEVRITETDEGKEIYFKSKKIELTVIKTEKGKLRLVS